jgi:hypothetical protein
MKYLILTLLTISYFSVFSQKAVTVYTEPSDFEHRIYGGSLFPLGVHAGYELKYKRLQIAGFVGLTPRRYQTLVFDILQRIKNDYVNELGYLSNVAEPKIKFGGELKFDIGKNFAIGATAQTFNATLRDTPKKLTAGILPERLDQTNREIDFFETQSGGIKNLYENKVVEAYLNSILAGPVIEKTIWLTSNETIFIKLKAAYWYVVKRENDISKQDFTAIEQIGLDYFKPIFLGKIEKISSQLQAPSIGMELGISF